MRGAPAERLAAELRRRGLAVAARLLADAHQPVAPLLSDLGAATGPLLGMAAGASVGRFLGDERALDELITALEEAEGERGRAG